MSEGTSVVSSLVYHGMLETLGTRGHRVNVQVVWVSVWVQPLVSCVQLTLHSRKNRPHRRSRVPQRYAGCAWPLPRSASGLVIATCYLGHAIVAHESPIADPRGGHTGPATELAIAVALTLAVDPREANHTGGRRVSAA